MGVVRTYGVAVGAVDYFLCHVESIHIGAVDWEQSDLFDSSFEEAIRLYFGVEQHAND